ncbi:MAG TPA: biotin/lipoyl-binding protein, partial [Candidatus Binatus sp.]|nr:biotin/lipoyl-binding protein [Candidatus Binatus sp.]
FTTNARIYYPVTPIVPTLKGRVIEVPVTSNARLKDGDVLFRIDPKPFQYVVDEKKAALSEAEQKVNQLKETLTAASAQTKKANAELTLAQEKYDNASYLFQRQATPKTTLDTDARNLEAAKQSVEAAKAEEERARAAYTANVEGVNSLIARARAELADAQFDLDETTTRAAGPGFVTQVALRPGMYVIPTQLRTAMLFVNTGQRDRQLAAAFQQNSLQRVNPGDDAEVAFEAVPGRVFKAKVRAVVDAIAAGQLVTSSALIEPETRKASGRAIATIDVIDDLRSYQIPLGAKAEVAIYTQHLHDLSLLRKILLRMKSWKNYIFMEEG